LGIIRHAALARTIQRRPLKTSHRIDVYVVEEYYTERRTKLNNRANELTEASLLSAPSGADAAECIALD
jgi:hypothetical protein